jgi:hypothetical protein
VTGLYRPVGRKELGKIIGKAPHAGENSGGGNLGSGMLGSYIPDSEPLSDYNAMSEKVSLGRGHPRPVNR